MSLATYTFTSHVRRGFTPNANAEAPVTVRVAGQADIARGVAMMTPGDVVGIAPAQVIRSWPPDGVRNAEPNYLALVEFDAPDLPWLFSRPGAGGRVSPWVMLAVVEESQTQLDIRPEGTKVTVAASELPDPAEAWLWAHGQLLGTDTVPDDPARSLSRLVCPRRLAPDTDYLAVVVPTYEAGVRAGLGGVSDDSDPIRLSPEPWERDGEVELPVYHWWRFATGRSGDFEALVRRLRGVELPPGLGRRSLRLDHPLSTLPRAGGGDLELHVALRPVGETTDAIEAQAAGYLSALRTRLADADYDVSMLGDAPPRVGPPVHGQLAVGPAARVANLDNVALVPPWVRELNLDPRHRVAAGLGAEVVRRNQDHYAEEAWRQVGEVLTANRLRRRAEYSLAATTRLYNRWISRLDAGDLLTTTAPVHAKVSTAPGETVVGRLRDSPMPPAVVSVELRRFARARGRLAHATDWQEHAGVSTIAERSAETEPLVQRVPLDEIERLDPPSGVWGAVAAKDILTRLVEADEVADLEPTVAAERLDRVSKIDPFEVPTTDVVASRVAATQVDLDRTMSSIGLLPTAAVVAASQPEPEPEPEPLGGRGGGFLGRFRAGSETRLSMREGVDVTSALRSTEVIDTVREHPELVSGIGDLMVLDTVLLHEAARTGRAAASIDGAVFDRILDGTFQPEPAPDVDFALPADRFSDVADELGHVVVGVADLVIRPADAASRPGRTLTGGLESLRQPILAALDPAVTIQRAVNSRIAGLDDGRDQELDDIMAAPDLSEPTYHRLSAISQDWLLPGLDRLPADTTTLVAANLEFIASFLVGMNHELARELLWREYPTDLRGTYARQFWTHPATGNRDDQYDLKQELHRARSSSLPGLASTATDGARPEDPLVLVVKGELVQRYPGLIIVAAQTKSSAGHRVPTTTIEPDFVGVLAPDVMLVGFTSLTEKRVRDAEAGVDPDQKWWFFFAEHFSEPRFGLDEGPADQIPGPAPASWNDAGWQHTDVPPHGFLGAGTLPHELGKGVDPAASTRLRWGSSAAAQAWITLQFPFRRGIPARDLLPPPGGTS